MPWSVRDVDKHKKGMTRKQKKQWVAVANSALKSCMDDGGSEEDCAASAIKQANSVAGKAKETENYPVDPEYLAATVSAVWERMNAKDGDESEIDIEPDEEPETVMPPVTVPEAEPIGDFTMELQEKGKRVQSKMVNHLKAMKAALAAVLDWAEYAGQQAAADGKANEAAGAALPVSTIESGMSLDERASSIRKAFYSAFVPANRMYGEDSPWCNDVFEGDEELGNAVIVHDGGKVYSVSWEEKDDGFDFAPRNDWVEVRHAWVKVASEAEAGTPGTGSGASELAERGMGYALRLVEAGDGAAKGGNGVPLYLDVAIIRPGFGNSKDNHYYGADMLKKHAKVFEGVKMYESDHKAEEKSTRIWVSTVQKVEEFDSDGAPIGRIAIHDPAFAQKVVALNEAGLLEKMECSILATGTAKNGEVEGKKAKIVESIDFAESVDWVTRAGAGGRALRLSEMEEAMTEEEKDKKAKETPVAEAAEPVVIREEDQPAETPAETPAAEATPEPMAQAEVDTALAESGLPEIATKRLAVVTYADKAALDAAVAAEVEYLKTVTGSGKPFGLGAGGTAVSETGMTDEQYEEKMKSILGRHGVNV